ncbi:MAG: histidine phosphatase family protein [Acidiferrobacterales bacterium]|nr:histidine phosphatase family protein [Acidiferrobacterales bacterium]
MRLYLLRHGMTAPAEDDTKRRLTEDGIAALKKVIGRRRAALFDIDEVHSSPMGRVRQTAEIASQEFKFKGEITDNESLMKLTRADDIVPTLQHLTESSNVMLVSHESSLCNFLIWLTGDDVLMSNSSLTAVRTDKLEQGAGKILWQESPNSSEIKHTASFVDMF